MIGEQSGYVDRDAFKYHVDIVFATLGRFNQNFLKNNIGVVNVSSECFAGFFKDRVFGDR